MSSYDEKECVLKIDNQKDLANFVLSCVKNGTLIGLPSNSASPTDQWLVEFVDNTLYKYEAVKLGIKNGFMKIFVTRPLISEFSELKEKALLQEIKIYKTIQSIMQNQINGHFVRYLISVEKSETLTTENMFNFLQENINKSLVKSHLEKLKSSGAIDRNIVITDKFINDTILDNYYRNIACIFSSINNDYFQDIKDSKKSNKTTIDAASNLLEMIKKRPAVQNLTIDHLFIEEEIGKLKDNKGQEFTRKYFQDNVKLGFLVTESVKTDDKKFPNSFESLPTNYSVTLDILIKELKYHAKNNNKNAVEKVMKIILTVYFQIATACYSLYVNNIAHNDLHDGNIWVKELGEDKEIFYKLSHQIADKKVDYYYEVKSDKFSMIYDWDRSYKKWNRNALIEMDFAIDTNQSNELIEQRDFVKCLCYFISEIFELLYEDKKEKDEKNKGILSDEIEKYLFKNIVVILEIITKSIDDSDVKKINRQLQKLGFTKNDIESLANKAEQMKTSISTVFWLNVYLSKSTGTCFLNYDLLSGKSTGHIDKDLYNITLESMPIIIHNWHQILLKGEISNSVSKGKNVFNVDNVVKGNIITNFLNPSVFKIDKEINLYERVQFDTILVVREKMKKLKSFVSTVFASTKASIQSRLRTIKEEKKEEEEYNNPYESKNSISDYYGL